MTAKTQSRLAIAVMVSGLFAGVASFWWLCCRSPKIDFLTKSGTAEWILYPKPADGLAAPRKELSTEFRRSFVLDQAPAQATLTFRSLKRCSLTINGKPAGSASSPVTSWRHPVDLEVSGLLRAGTNEISVMVFNGYGPPALWLCLKAGSFRLDSDREWDSSEMGAVWRKARLATEPMTLGKAHRIFGLDAESTWDCVANRWPTLLMFGVLAGGVVGGGAWWFKQGPGRLRLAGMVGGSSFATRALVGVAIIWAALFLHNLRLLPNTVGFDNLDHLAYVNFIQTQWALPLPSDGMEMYHAPLYYLLCNAVLAPMFAGVFSDLGVYAMRVLGLLVGISNCTFIFLSCRLLFPSRAGAQLLALVLAACIPAHLYLCHYITNEPLSAALVSGAIYFCLRMVTGNTVSWRLSAGAGICLGGALLTKITALVAVPFILGALAHWLLITRPRNLRAWITTIGVLAVSSLGIVGWYYLRMWHYCGTPIVNIPGEAGSQIWADDGFRTIAYYTRFGRCLVRPAYSVFSSFADGIYSTFWGDALYGGQASVGFRPPWNYDLMGIGALLALIPTALILTGAGSVVWRFARRPEPAWLLLIGLSCAMVASMVYVSLKLPFYFNVKGFYGLIALLPICSFGAVGWEVLSRCAGRLRVLLAVALGVWAMNAYACFWIRGGAAATSITRAMFLAREHRINEALRLLEDVLQRDPQNVTARESLAMTLSAQGRMEEALAHIEAAVTNAPDEAEVHLIMASILSRQGKLEAAVQQARKAKELAPDLPAVYPPLCEWLSRLGQNQEAVTEAREGLRLTPTSPELHYLLGLALAKIGESTPAVEQLRLACDFKSDSVWLGTLADNYAKAGKFDEAVDALTRAIKLAEAAGNQDLAETDRGLLERYQTKQPYQER